MASTSLDLGTVCTSPLASFSFSLPTCPTTGVHYVAIVSYAQPEGVIDISPNLTDVHIGDTLVMTSGESHGVFFPTSGQLTLEFRAKGTPTVVGEQHTCGYFEPWISDLGFCPESLSFYPDMQCVVQTTTQVSEALHDDGQLIFPCEGNGFHLSSNRTIVEGSFLVTDATGRMVRSGPSSQLNAGVYLFSVAIGPYSITLTDRAGNARTERFVISAQ